MANNNIAPNREIEIITAEEILMAGLRLIFTEERIMRVKNGDPATSEQNKKRFKAHFGASCYVIAALWEALQTTSNIPIDQEPNAKLSLSLLLQTLHFLYRYPTEVEREGFFDVSPKTLRKWSWYYAKRIQALKAEKITFPQCFTDGDSPWLMTVDGVHCATNEPIHADFSKDKAYFSHKKKRAGLCYELGIDLYESKLIWMNGPFKAGRNDNGNFVQGGLKQTLAAIGKKALGDKAYNGHPNECSTFNAFDTPAVKSFKSRAQMRHEQFNGMIKEFSCLDIRFRHGETHFKTCFEAVCVICQYRLDIDEPLFHLLAGIHLEDIGETDAGTNTSNSGSEDEEDTDEEDEE